MILFKILIIFVMFFVISYYIFLLEMIFILNIKWVVYSNFNGFWRIGILLIFSERICVYSGWLIGNKGKDFVLVVLKL